MKRIAITGATGQIAYSLVFRIAHGDIFGNEEIALHLLDLPGTEKMMQGLVMELEDCSFPLLKEVHFGIDAHKAFEEIDIALLIGSKPRSIGMERADLLMENGKIFVTQGKALDASAKKNAKVIVVGNPCNTNCLIALHYAPSLNPLNFHAMMRLDQNRATSLLAKKANVASALVENVTIWGNHSASQVPDFLNATINHKPALEVIDDREWLQGEFIQTVQKRGAQIIEARGKSSAASAANAVIEEVKSLYFPIEEGRWFTSGVLSDNNPYGIEPGLIFGFPLVSEKEGYKICKNLEWDFFLKEKIAVTQQELIAERDCVKDLL